MQILDDQLTHIKLSEEDWIYATVENRLGRVIGVAGCCWERIGVDCGMVRGAVDGGRDCGVACCWVGGEGEERERRSEGDLFFINSVISEYRLESVANCDLK